MNTKGIKFLAVLAVLAMAFAAFAVVSDSDSSDAVDVNILKPTGDNPASEVRTGSTITVKLLTDVEVSAITLLSTTEVQPKGGEVSTIDDKNVVIDLNGHDMEADITTSVGLTITGTGKVTGDVTASSSLTIDKDVVIAGTVAYTGTATTEFNLKGTVEGAVTISGTDTKATIDSTAKVESKAEYAVTSEGADLTVKGEITGVKGIEISSGKLFVKSTATITAEVTAVKSSGESSTAIIELQGGNITGAIDARENSIEDPELTKVSGGVYSDYSVFKYTTRSSTGANVNAGGIMIPGAAPVAEIKEGSFASGVWTIKSTDLVSGTNIFNLNKLSGLEGLTKIIIDAADRNVVFIGNSTDVTAEVQVNSGAVAFYGFSSIAGSLNDDDDDEIPAPVAFAELVGTFTFSKGALDANMKAGTITLGDGEELVLSGTIEALGEDDGELTAANIAVASGKAAKVIIEAGEDKTLNVLGKFTIGDGIAVDVNGKITGKMNVDDDTPAPAGTITVNKALEAFPGAVIENVTVSVGYSADGADAVAWSGSDINFAKVTPEQWTGKDAANGTWSVKKQSDVLKLTLNNYQGTYNFLPFTSEKVEVVVAGNVVVSYAPVKYIFNYFDADFTTLQDKGTFTLNVDLTQAEFLIEDFQIAQVARMFSDVTEMEDVSKIAYISADKIETVGMNINVTGTPAWTAEELKLFPVIGLIVGGYVFADNDNEDGTFIDGKLYSAPINIDVLSNEGYGLGIGAAIVGEVTNCSTISAKGSVGGIAMKAEVKDTKISGQGSLVDVLFDGTVSSNSSITGETVYVTGATIEQESTIDAANLVIAGDTINNGTIKASGMSIIWKSADLENYAVFENSGKMGVFGTITNYPGLVENTAGVINNTGDIIFHADMIEGINGKITFTADAEDIPTAASKIKLKTVDIRTLSLIEILAGINIDDFNDKNLDEIIDEMMSKEIAFDMDGVEAIIDGAMPVNLCIYDYVTYTDKTTNKESYPSEDYTCNTVFKGTMVYNSEGYAIDVKDGSTTISIECKYDYTAKVLETYEVAVSGSVTLTKNEDHSTVNVSLENFSKKDELSVTGRFSNIESSYCSFQAIAGVVNSTGSFILDSTSDKVTIMKDATFNGDMTVLGMPLTIAGTFNGNVNAPAVKLDGTMTGDITASGNVAAPVDDEPVDDDFAIVEIAGELNGNIAAYGDVKLAGKVIGNIAMSKEESKITVTGTAKASVTYSGEYISAKATKEGETDTISEFEVKFDIDTAFEADNEGKVIINMMASQPADTANAGVPGYIAFGTDAAIKGKAQTTVTAGALKFGASYAVPTGYEIVIEQGAILEVAKSTVLDVTKAALKVNKQATMNYNNDDFGEVKFIMSLETAAGYIIYSNIAYALANCDENSVLTLGANGAIDADADVMKGVKLVVADGLELTINADINLTMQDGAKFVIEGTGTIVIKATNVEDKKENSVSGVFEFDGNVVEFENAVFADDAELAGLKETADTPSMLDVDVNYYGKMIAVSGNITGDITLVADSTTDKDGKVIKNFGALDVAADATINNAEIKDKSSYAYTDKDAEKAKQVWSIITVDGKIIASDLTINGEYAGNGQVIVAEDGAVTIKGTAILNVKIADANGNGYEFVGVDFSVIEIESSKLSADYIVKIKGTLVNGQINALKDAYLDGLTIGYMAEKEVTPATGGDNAGAGETDPTTTGKVIIPADNTFEAVFVADKTTILDTTYAYGKLKTKTLVDEDKKLVYDATYADGDYTVYTHFLNIDQSEVTDITVDGNALSKNLGEKDLVIAGINLTIADKTVLVLKNNMIVGTPRTTLGAGTTVIGNIIIPAGKFVLVYYDADVTAANFYGPLGDNTEKDMSKYPVAVTSAFDIEGSPYAVAYANANDVVLDTVAKVMKPAIAGYTFTQWTAYNGAKLDAAKVGETDVTATLVAGKVTINATAYEGVAYYCNGVEFMTTGMDVQVDVGSVFTAKIVDKDKLEGSPLVNGAASFKVVDEYTVLEISGVTEKKAPSNDDDDDDGLGLTEILLIVLVVLIAVMCVILILRLNRS